MPAFPPPSPIPVYTTAAPFASGDTTGAADYTNLTAAIARCSANGSVLFIPNGIYYINAPLVISNSMGIYGESLTTTPASEQGPNAVSQLYGVVIIQVTAATDVFQITGTHVSVMLDNIGMGFGASITDSNTGHGINCYTGISNSNGQQLSRWRNLICVGVDGNHYGFVVASPLNCRFELLYNCGGGGLLLVNAGSSTHGNYGNSQFDNFFSRTVNAGSSHGVCIQSNGQSGAGGNLFNLCVFIRPNIQVASPATTSQMGWNDYGGSVSYTVSACPNGTPAILTTSLAHNLINGQAVTASGIGNVPNGTYYALVSQYSSTQFALYSNSALTAAVTSAGTFTAGGTITYAPAPDHIVVFAPDIEATSLPSQVVFGPFTAVYNPFITGGSGAGNQILSATKGNPYSTSTNITAFGTNELTSNVSGTNNVTVGSNNMQDSVADSNMVAVGYNAAQKSFGASDCIMIGPNAGQWNFSGIRNIYIGSGCGQGTIPLSGATNATPIVVTCTNGSPGLPSTSQLVFITGINGNTAANGWFWATAGSSGNLINLYYDQAKTQPVSGNGAYTSGGAMFVCSSQQLNTAVGFQAMQYTGANGGQSNVAIGAFSLQNVNRGFRNVAVGTNSGQYVVYGQYNTFLGQYAGTQSSGGANAIVNGANNTFVGYKSSQSSGSDSSNQTAVGYQSQTNGTYASAFGSGASAGASGAVAIGTDSSGTGASTSTANVIAIGTANHTISIAGLVNSSAAFTTVNGSAGSYKWSMPFQGSSYKKVMIYLNGYTNAGTSAIVFPVAFTGTPVIVGNNTTLTVSTISSTGLTIPIATTITGFLIVEGF